MALWSIYWQSSAIHASSETPALKMRLEAIDEQRRVLAYDLGGRYRSVFR